MSCLYVHFKKYAPGGPLLVRENERLITPHYWNYTIEILPKRTIMENLILLYFF